MSDIRLPDLEPGVWYHIATRGRHVSITREVLRPERVTRDYCACGEPVTLVSCAGCDGAKTVCVLRFARLLGIRIPIGWRRETCPACDGVGRTFTCWRCDS